MLSFPIPAEMKMRVAMKGAAQLGEFRKTCKAVESVFTFIAATFRLDTARERGRGGVTLQESFRVLIEQSDILVPCMATTH